MIVAFARENNFVTGIGEKSAGRLLSATSVKVGDGFRLALPTGAYHTWKGSTPEGTPLDPDLLSNFDWRQRRLGVDDHLAQAISEMRTHQRMELPRKPQAD
jgi:C-terminal processing protease CtpA/Prc